jgi:hypothetical protein
MGAAIAVGRQGWCSATVCGPGLRIAEDSRHRGQRERRAHHPSTYKAKLAIEAQPMVVGYAVSAAGRQPISRARLKGSVRIAGVTLTNLDIYPMDGGRPNIGLPVLRRIKVTYDHGNARSWIGSDATIDMSQPTKG